MRFLVDAQLPPALARFLASLGEEAVLDVGNCSKTRLIEIFTIYWESIKAELNRGALLIEIA